MANTEYLEQYDILISCLNYENSMLWQRANFFLVASTAYLGFASSQASQLSPTSCWQSILGVLVSSIAGLAICQLWSKGLGAGKFWIHHWLRNLQTIELDAYGDMHLLRRFEPAPGQGYPPRVRATGICDCTVWLFRALWLLMLVYAVIVAVLRLTG